MGGQGNEHQSKTDRHTAEVAHPRDKTAPEQEQNHLDQDKQR